jgi:rRNA maturation protein Nop10
MASIRCPHCGKAKMIAGGWGVPDRCAACGHSLASSSPLRAEPRVREQLRRAHALVARKRPSIRARSV